jgi:hypothetical protein
MKINRTTINLTAAIFILFGAYLTASTYVHTCRAEVSMTIVRCDPPQVRMERLWSDPDTWTGLMAFAAGGIIFVVRKRFANKGGKGCRKCS